MTNTELYIGAFKTVFGLDDEEAIKTLGYQEIVEWDSVGHMELIAAIEDAFEIMMEMDDIVDFSSFDKGLELLKKYDVEF